MRGFGAEVGRAICPSTVTGRCCVVGCVRIGASPKRNSRSTWGFSSSCTTCESEAKRCWERSLSYSSQKTLESNKSVLENLRYVLLIFNGLRSRHDQRALLVYHYLLLPKSSMSWNPYPPVNKVHTAITRISSRSGFLVRAIRGSSNIWKCSTIDAFTVSAMGHASLHRASVGSSIA